MKTINFPFSGCWFDTSDTHFGWCCDSFVSPGTLHPCHPPGKAADFRGRPFPEIGLRHFLRMIALSISAIINRHLRVRLKGKCCRGRLRSSRSLPAFFVYIRKGGYIMKIVWPIQSVHALLFFEGPFGFLFSIAFRLRLSSCIQFWCIYILDRWFNLVMFNVAFQNVCFSVSIFVMYSYWKKSSNK